MGIPERRPFSPTGEYSVRKPLRFHGKDYPINTVFPWRKLSCSARKLRDLHGAGYLLLKGEGDVIETPVVETPEADVVETPVEPSVETPLEEPTEERQDPILIFDPEIHTLTGEEGNWSVSLEEDILFRVTDEAAAELDGITEAAEIYSEDIIEE